MSNDAAQVGAAGSGEDHSTITSKQTAGQSANHDAILAGGQGQRTVQSESDPNDRSEQSYSAADTHNESGKGVGEKIKDAFKGK